MIRNSINIKNEPLTSMIIGLTSEFLFIISIVGLLVILGVGTEVTQQKEAYAQGNAAIYDEIDESHQPLITEILDALQNQTADEININERGQMVIIYRDAVNSSRAIPSSPTAPPTPPSILNNANSMHDPLGSGDISIIMPHNFTSQNGYEFRDSKIYKPDGTELFS